MKGFKGFNKSLQCRDKQYEIGQTYEKQEVELCNKGLHFCERPHDVFAYYNAGESRFAEIEAEEVSKEKDSNDSKRACKKLTVKAEISVFHISFFYFCKKSSYLRKQFIVISRRSDNKTFVLKYITDNI